MKTKTWKVYTNIEYVLVEAPTARLAKETALITLKKEMAVYGSRFFEAKEVKDE